MMDSDSGYDVGNDNACDAGLDNYESGDNSGLASDLSPDDEIQDACNKYEANSGSFEFSSNGEKIVLKVAALYKNVDEFRKAVKVFAIHNGFRLKGVKNEKSRVTLTCTAQVVVRGFISVQTEMGNTFKSKYFSLNTFMLEVVTTMK